MLKLRFVNALYKVVKEIFEQCLEFFLRGVLMCIPLGVYIYLLQSVSKPKTTTALSVNHTEKSTWMFVAPGVILSCVDGHRLKQLKNMLKRHMDANFSRYLAFLRCLTYIYVIIFCTIMLVVR